MSRYIDADALMERLLKLTVVTDDMYGMGIARGIERAETAIQMQPTADVEEVRHGEWKDRHENKYANHYYECSVCGKPALDRTVYNALGNPRQEQALSPYCPECGAKMDCERREE